MNLGCKSLTRKTDYKLFVRLSSKLSPAPLYLKQPKGKLANKILKETEIKQFFLSVHSVDN